MAEIVHITNCCNQDCIFCIYDRLNSNKFLTKKRNTIGPDINEIKKKIDLFKKNVISFMGGEPFMRKDIIELFKYAKSIGIKKIGANTNGSFLYNYDFVKTLKENGLKFLLISLHSHIESEQEMISQTKGNFKKTIKGILNAQKLGIEIIIEHVVFSKNYLDLVDFIKFISYFKQIQRVDFLFIRPNTKSKEIIKLIPKMSDVMPYLFKAFKLCNKLEIPFLIQNIPYCLLGEFKDKHMHYLYNKEQLNEEIRLNDYGNKDNKCSSCSLNYRCVGLTKGYYDLYTAKELKPI